MGGETAQTDSFIKVGDHVYHVPSKDYLGVATKVTDVLIHFDGPRTRDGEPVTIGSVYECVKGPPPASA